MIWSARQLIAVDMVTCQHLALPTWLVWLLVRDVVTCNNSLLLDFQDIHYFCQVLKKKLGRFHRKQKKKFVNLFKISLFSYRNPDSCNWCYLFEMDWRELNTIRNNTKICHIKNYLFGCFFQSTIETSLILRMIKNFLF